MKAVSDARGVIAAAAMDQRGSLQKSLAKEKRRRGRRRDDGGVQDPRHRSADAARQRDPARSRMGHCRRRKRRAKNAGPAARVREDRLRQDRRPAGCPTCSTYWSVRRLKEAGADCLKILLYYTPFDPKNVNDQKHAWVERIGDECRANDIPFFLEFVGYEEGARREGPRVREEEARDRHRRAWREFTQGPLRRGRDEGRSADQHEVRRRREVVRRRRRPTRARRRRSCSSKPAKVATKPFIYPVGRRQQRRVHRIARARGRSPACASPACSAAARRGRTASRSTPRQGAAAFRTWLETKGVENINNVNAALKPAQPVVRVLRREERGRAGVS